MTFLYNSSEASMGVDCRESIQAMASPPTETIPTEFIRSEAEQTGITNYLGLDVLDIPIVDLGETEMAKLVEAVAAAGREWGMFQVVNHGIPVDLIKRVQNAGKEFFELPLEEKRRYAKPPGAPGIEGYGNPFKDDPDGKKFWIENLYHWIWPPSAVNYRYWPQNPPSYREVTEAYTTYIRQVVDKLFLALSLGLGLEENALKVALGGEDMQFNLKIGFYPPCPRPELALGVPAHTDFGGITILAPNEVPGLQAMKDACWFNTKYIPNALVVNIGDQMEILSNGKYISRLHRAIADKERTRMSWAVFVKPPPVFVVGPLPEMVDNDNPLKYKTKKFKDYVYCKLNKIPQ